MLILYNTDAPLYHRPLATVGLIAVNTMVLLALVVADDVAAFEPYALSWGDGLHPVQWVTGSFLHCGLVHLFGNMMILWGFGLIIEGKLGWWRFLLVYLGIGVVESMIEQALMLGAAGGSSIGASSILFGLIAIALVWAPENEVSAILLVFIRPFHFDMTVYAYAVVSIGIEVLILVSDGFCMASAALHLLGAIVGLTVGIVMLRRGMVDCENWDLFSIWRGRNRMSPEQSALADAKKITPADREERLASATDQIRWFLTQGNPLQAFATYQLASSTFNGWRLAEADFFALLAGLDKQTLSGEAVPAMVEYLKHYSERADLVRLKLADILIRNQQRPAQAMKVLSRIDNAKLSPSQAGYRQKLEFAADKLRNAGVLELQTEDW